MVAKRIEKVVIVGGGTAGWMTAASLAKYLEKSSVDICLVECSAIGTVGVGEATIPTIRRFYAELGLSDADVLKATQGTCKLGIEFKDWWKKDSSFFHPFGLFGQDIKNVGFHHFWKKLRDLGDTTDISAYSLAVQMAKKHKFSPPLPKPPTPLSVFDWALHFDATLFGQLMRDNALHRGVTHIDGTIADVELDETNGFIRTLHLSDGRKVDGELFIDCSGFKGLLIEEALQTGYEDWSHWLKCDSAIAVQSETIGAPVPYTISKAHSAGWQWTIPLQTRMGNGHVFASDFISQDEALHQLTQNIPGELATEPRLITFKAGRRLKAWNRNCIAVGLSAGFIEPLESTSIALIENGITRIKMLFPDKSFNQSCIDEFNEMTRLEYEACRDFIILHYKASERDDSDFWRSCREMDIPPRLAHKLEVFRARGHIVKYRWEIFQNPSWIAVYSGNGIIPETYDPLVDNYEVEYLRQTFTQMRESIDGSLAPVHTHAEFLKRNGMG